MHKFQVLVPIVRNYPEFIFRMVLFNSSPTMTRVVDIFKGLFRRWFKSWFSENSGQFENDAAKLRIVPVGSWERVSESLHADCIGASVASHASKNTSDNVPP